MKIRSEKASIRESENAPKMITGSPWSNFLHQPNPEFSSGPNTISNAHLVKRTNLELNTNPNLNLQQNKVWSSLD